MKRSAYRSRDSYAQVNWAMVKETGDITTAAVFDWIAWKADAAYDGIVDNDGHVWFPASMPTLAETMHVSEKVIRRALNTLVDGGHLVTTTLRTGGAYDRTNSYRPVWDDEREAATTAAESVRDNDDSAGAESSETTTPEGGCICPTGQMHDDPEGRCHLPYRADVPLFETSTEVKDKNSLSAGEITAADAPIERTIDQFFDMFWAWYPRRESKKAALAAFIKAAKKLRPTELVQAAIDYHNNPNRNQDPKHLPHAATWLNGERWTDEIAASPPPGQPPSRQSAVDHNLALVEHFRNEESHGQHPDRRALDAGIGS